MEKEEEKVLGSLFAKFADENNVSIIKIGEDVDKDEEIKRLNKSCRVYQEKFSELKQRADEEKDNAHVLKRENDVLRREKEVLKRENKNINAKIVKFEAKIKELQEEIKIRIQNSNGFNILDIRD